MLDQNYPGIFDRVKAVFVDSLVLIIFMIIITDIFSFFDTVSDTIRIISFVFIFILYDPILISFFGGTLGHKVIGLRVKREKNEKKNILFPIAIMRFIVKSLLGWVSLITISGSKKRRAIHDTIAGSVVVYNS